MKCFFFKNSSSSEEFKNCLPVNVNTTFATLAPAIASAEQDFIVPIIGKSLFDDLSDKYYNDQHTAEPYASVVENLQFAIIRLAYWDSFDQLSVMMSDNGISDQNGENRVYRYQADNLRKNLFRQGYQRLKQAVAIIEAHMTDFPLFSESAYYAINNASLIKSTADFDSLVPIDEDFRIFSRLRRFITTVEDMDLSFRLGQELAAALMTNSSEQRFVPILPAVRMYVACRSYAEGLPFLHTNAIGEKLTEKANEGAVANIDQKSIDNLCKLYNERADRYMATVINYCKNHLDVFPELGGGENAKTRPTIFRDNNHKKTVKL